MSDLEDLYQEVILDHGRNPRNFRVIEGASADAEGLNPLCGDHYHVYLKLEGHFMSGYAEYALVRGFYGPQNPNGFSPFTHMLMLRTGFNF